MGGRSFLIVSLTETLVSIPHCDPWKHLSGSFFLFYYLLRSYLKWELGNMSFLGTTSFLSPFSGAEMLGPKS